MTEVFQIRPESSDRTLLQFQGQLDQGKIDDLIINAEAILRNSEPDVKVRKKVFSILVEIFRKLERLSDQGHTTRVTWYYDEEDEDMQESGEDFKEIIRLPVEMVVMNS
ncbi:SiaC family regulatory phosphoprotein [Roseivirga sp. BDSF3-8]|uniref:SiaC family regulatory phosphoprotein n=1 Tax=Roseivirga sp. BDSF3-8 TaxID=3241598 RepID=UPI00353195CC